MLSKLQAIFWKLYSPFALFLGFGMLGLLCMFWMPLAFILNLILPTKMRHLIGRLAIRIGLTFYLIFLAVFCGCRFEITVRERDFLNGSGIIVGNHPSLLDAILLLALIPNTICVMKSSLLDNPLLGASARLAGFIRNADPFDMIAHAREGLGEGSNLLIFPEGTRSASSKKVNKLSQSVALLSSKLDLPIRTFLITYDQGFLGKTSKLNSIPKLPMKITIRSGEAFSPRKDYADLTDDLEKYMNYELEDAI